jgi:hypothetical protein
MKARSIFCSRKPSFSKLQQKWSTGLPLSTQAMADHRYVQFVTAVKAAGCVYSNAINLPAA